MESKDEVADADEQTEFNMGSGRPAGSDPMDDAVAAAIRASGGAAPSPEVQAAARARASQMLNELGDEGAEGIQDLQNLYLSIGLPTARNMFLGMIKAANLRGAAKQDAMTALTKFSPVSEVGCMKVDFFNSSTNSKDAAYLLLDKCTKTHNFDTQVSRIKPHIPEESWNVVIKHLSMLIHIGRSVYGQIARKNIALIRTIFSLPEDDPCEQYLDLQVDGDNTTLFLDADWPSRAGIFIKLEADVQADLEKAKKKAAKKAAK